VPRILLLVVVLAACASPRPRPPEAPPRGPVTVAIVVDQFAAWVAEERLPLLPETGGFARLRREGTWMQRVRYAHALTDTATGHAALYTGAPPRESGIWTNERIADDGKHVSLFLDPDISTIAPDGPRGPGSSPRPLKRPTLADRLVAARPEAMVISVSLKDRAAIIGAGRRPTAALWFDRGLDTFVTSSAYAPRFPGWAVPIAGHDALVARRARAWQPLDPAWIEAHAGRPDDAPGEGDLGGYGTTFPHDTRNSKDPAKAFRSSPFADEVVLDLALAAVEELHNQPVPLFLAVSLSANDYVGHLFGPESREAWDELYRLDAALGRFFAALDKRYGERGWSVVLTADHGVSRSAKVRIIQGELGERLDRVAVAEFGEGPWVAGVVDPYVELTRKARELPREKLDALMELLRRALEAEPGVLGARDTRFPPASCPPLEDESVDALICRSQPPFAVAAIYVVLGNDGFWDPDLVVGTGGNHGSVRDEDRTVPLFVRAPGRVAGGRVVTEPQSYLEFGEWVSRLLGLPDAR